jgi:hypothetical protein
MDFRPSTLYAATGKDAPWNLMGFAAQGAPALRNSRRVRLSDYNGAVIPALSPGASRCKIAGPTPGFLMLPKTNQAPQRERLEANFPDKETQRQ